MYQQGRLTHFASFSPKSYMAAAAESESAKQELHTRPYTTALAALGASHRPVFSHHTNPNTLK